MNAQHLALIRGAIMLLSVLFSTNTIPTGVDGGGQKVADMLMVIAVSLAAGDKTPSAVTEAVKEGRI